MYELLKISTNAHNTDGSKIYETHMVRTFKGLVEFIQRNDQFYTYGSGSDVFINNVWFCHTSELTYCLSGDSTMTLTEFKQTWGMLVTVRAYYLGDYNSMCLELKERNIKDAIKTIKRTVKNPEEFNYVIADELDGNDGVECSWSELT